MPKLGAQELKFDWYSAEDEPLPPLMTIYIIVPSVDADRHDSIRSFSTGIIILAT
jgi:hypothetical protein